MIVLLQAITKTNWNNDAKKNSYLDVRLNRKIIDSGRKTEIFLFNHIDICLFDAYNKVTLIHINV